MRFATALAAALSLPLIASAAPIQKRISDTDLLVLKFANVLEQLETEFYKQAIAKFSNQDFIDAGYTATQVPIDLLVTIQGDEAAHTDFLAQALGDQVLDTCRFNFDPVLTDVATTMAAARLVENVGVGAYIGGGLLLDDKSILAAAAQILTIESRHQTALNVLNGQTGIPAAFDLGLRPEQVLSLAGPFISGCDLGITPNLPVTVQGVPTRGQNIQFDLSGLRNQQGLFCQMIVGGQAFASVVSPVEACQVPADLAEGPVLLFITTDNQPLASNIAVQDVTKIAAGPAILFIDDNNDSLANLVLQDGRLLSVNNNNGNNGNFNNGGLFNNGQDNFDANDAQDLANLVNDFNNGSNGDIRVVGAVIINA